MKKIFVYFFSFLLFFSFSSFLLAAKKDKYKRWLNEDVYWIITHEEEEAFKKLKSDKEKEKFIALFWAKRDPTPFTEKNEFKEAYYSRLNYVNLKYTRGQEMGWKTDVGKILIFFGLPRERKTNPETWVYNPIRFLNISDEFQIVFDIVEEKGLVLDEKLTSKVALDTMDNYASKTIFHPQLKEIPKYKKKFILDPQSSEGKIIEKASTEAHKEEEIPLDFAFHFSKAERGSTRVTIVCFLDSEKTGIEKGILFGRIKAEDETFEDFQKKVNMEKEDYFVYVDFPAMPKKYELYFGLRDEKSNRYSVFKKEIEVPNYWKDELELGSFILTDKVEIIESGSKKTSAFNFGQYFAYPMREMVFKKKDTLNILYQIYNAKIENNKAKLLQEIFLKKEGRTYKLPPSLFEREVPEGQVIVSGFPIPLSAVDPGKYELLVKITDKISNQGAEKKADIIVVE